MIYIVEDERYDDLEDAVDAVIDNIDTDEFDEFLNEVYSDIEIAGVFYSPARVLHKVDPIYYNCAFCDWTDGLRDEIAEAIEGMRYGDSETVYGVDVEVGN